MTRILARRRGRSGPEIRLFRRRIATAALEGLEAERVVEIELLGERRSVHPFDRLSREFDAVCTTAIDAHQIAAALEARGFSDRTALEVYGVPDVFSLATELYRRVPLRASDRMTRHAEVDPGPSTLTLILRGPIYLLPTLFFLSAGGLFRDNAVIWFALGALLLAWAWNQGAGVLVHRLIGGGGRTEARRMARWSLVAGTILVAAVVWPAAAVALDNHWLGLYAGAQTAYLIASASLLTFAHDRLLLLVLAPVAVAAALSLVLTGLPDTTVVALGAGTVVAVTITMVLATRSPRGTRIPTPTVPEFRIASVHALLGGAWAGLIALAGYAIAPDPEVITTVSIAAIPMVLVMGVAEWQLVSLRIETRRLLAAARRPKDFAHHIRHRMLQAFAIYAAAILVAATAAVLIAARFYPMEQKRLALSFAFVVLGCAMFSGLVLASFGRAPAALAASGLAMAATAGLIAVARTGAFEPVTAFAAGCAGLAASLTITSRRAATQAVVHR